MEELDVLILEYKNIFFNYLSFYLIASSTSAGTMIPQRTDGRR